MISFDFITGRLPGFSAKRGVFAYIVDGDAEELQSAIDITLQRFAEYQSLQGAFGRRAVIEQAKGILMARHSVDADRAFEMLRVHSQHNGRKVVDVAQAIVDSHLLLTPSLAELAAEEPSRHQQSEIANTAPQDRLFARSVVYGRAEEAAFAEGPVVESRAPRLSDRRSERLRGP